MQPDRETDVVKFRARLVFCLIGIGCAPARGDGFALDRVYHPYVEPKERELEWRAHGYPADADVGERMQVHRIAYGQAIGERWFGELYVVAESEGGGALAAEGWEVELRHQLTEQGEYWADWGLVFELERERGGVWEASSGVLVEKEHGRWSTTLNLSLGVEWGAGIDSEPETRLAVQTRWRLSPLFEPAIELHVAEDTLAAGPVVLGELRLANRRKLHWEAGFYSGFGARTPERAFRAAIEFGF